MEIWLSTVGLIVLGVIISGLSGVFQTALYHYAATGTAPGQAFNQAQLADSFRPRTGRR